MIGTVFNIQGYATHDGPGIRTTVFLKGCPLSCAWCHNPEGRTPHPELSVNPERCIGCRSCAEVCPTGAISFEDGSPVTDLNRCDAGGACVTACPSGARRILGQEYTVAALLEILEKDRVFYDASGGGVTFSGGEPLQQSEFLLACLEGCAAGGLHTAVDTSGIAATDTLRRVARVTDLFLYDLKVMDDADHRRATGASNTTVLANLRLLSELGSNVWVRLPLIPGFNDRTANLESVASFIQSLPMRYPVHVLPYHRIGRHKYSRIGARDEMEDLAEPQQDRMAEIAETLRGLGLETRIGG